MRTVWMVVAALAWIVLAADARADTVYLTDGDSVWGMEVHEEDDTVVVVRPDGDLRIPKSEVSRIERVQSTIPPSYAPPSAEPAPEPPAEAGVPAPPAAPGGEAPPAPPAGGASPVPPPPARAPIQLPPPPPPPPPARY